MDRSIVAFIEGIVTLAVFAAIGLTGFSIWSRLRMRNQPPVDGLLDAMRDENAQIYADLNARIAELEERVDFAEQRLVPERRQIPSPTARIPTPV